MKICTKCGQEKGKEEFTKDRGRKDGLNPWCRGCTRANNRRVYAQKREHYQEKHKEYNAAHPEKIQAANRRYYERNKDEVNAKAIAFDKAHPELARERWRRRYVREANAEGSHAVEEWEEVLAAADDKCLVCGTDENITKDHIVPLSRGGTDYIENIQPLCHSCNASKGNRYIEDYR